MKTINLPIYKGSTVLFESYEDMVAISQGRYNGPIYGTSGSPNQHAFEFAMTEFGGYRTWSFQSGISAITNTILAFVKSGDHILVVDNVYNPTRTFCDTILSRFGITTDYLPADVGLEVVNHIKPETRLIFLESPGTNTFEIQDIPAITSIANQREIITVLDNTWATPLYLNPFDLGVDVSIHSVTKYISGHSDILMGSVTTNKKYSDIFNEFYNTMQIYVSPEDSYMALRGLQTLEVRLKQHESSASLLANYLSQDKRVEKVLYPAFNYRWKKMFTGSTGLFSIVLKDDYSDEKISRAVKAMKHFSLGYGWGGYKSLITIGAYFKRNYPLHFKNKIMRISIGLEEVSNLKDDLDKFLNILDLKI
jgi:cystathionine beta-lyase